MSPIDYLRAMTKRKPKYATGGLVTAEQAAIVASGCVHPGPGYLLPKPAPAAKPLPKLDWTNPVRTVGACTHDVIYSRCTCPATNISTETTAADFPADQQR